MFDPARLVDKTIYVVSDLHLGDRSCRDNFYYYGNRDAFLSFLEFVKGDDNHFLLILGDLFEFWQCNLSTVIMENLDLLEKIAGLRYAYVIGNHDIDLQEFIDTPLLRHDFFDHMIRDFHATIGERRFYFLHGHEIDEFNRDLSPSWGRILTIVAGIFEEYNGGPILKESKGRRSVEERLEYMGECVLRIWNRVANLFTRSRRSSPKYELTPAQSRSRQGVFFHQLERLRKDPERGFDVVVCGHTHSARVMGNWYCNAGFWAKDYNTFARISREGGIELFRWLDNNPIRI
jgi:UDP-2,3-diacylglucosamine pyrophosphatase LpxH